MGQAHSLLCPSCCFPLPLSRCCSPLLNLLWLNNLLLHVICLIFPCSRCTQFSSSLGCSFTTTPLLPLPPCLIQYDWTLCSLYHVCCSPFLPVSLIMLDPAYFLDNWMCCMLYSDQKNWFTRGQILLVSQIVAQITKVNPWEFMTTKPCIFFFVMPKLRALALAHHLT